MIIGLVFKCATLWAVLQIGPFKLTAEQIDSILDEAAAASEGGEKAQPLGIEADYGGARDVLLMTGLNLEKVANRLKVGGATGPDGGKFLFMTDAQLAKFNKVCAMRD